jgi:hypothetical protein
MSQNLMQNVAVRAAANRVALSRRLQTAKAVAQIIVKATSK